MRTKTRTAITLSMGALAALALTAGPAAAEHDYHGHRAHGARISVVFNKGWGGHGKHHGHHHGPSCYKVWVPGGYEVVTERVWVPGHYEEVVQPWVVEWTWVGGYGKYGHGGHVVVTTDDPYNPPHRKHGHGHWQKRIVRERCVGKEWVPGHYETVQKKVHRPGHYEWSCSLH